MSVWRDPGVGPDCPGQVVCQRYLCFTTTSLSSGICTTAIWDVAMHHNDQGYQHLFLILPSTCQWIDVTWNASLFICDLFHPVHEL